MLTGKIAATKKIVFPLQKEKCVGVFLWEALWIDDLKANGNWQTLYTDARHGEHTLRGRIEPSFEQWNCAH